MSKNISDLKLFRQTGVKSQDGTKKTRSSNNLICMIEEQIATREMVRGVKSLN